MSEQKIKRIYHPYHLWEDYKAGMWISKSPQEEAELFEKAVAFTGNADLYGEWMLKAIEAWPIACEHNLSCTTMNRQAFIGHSACFLAIGCPEHITRKAWHFLTQEQQDKANAKADYAIQTWEDRQLKKESENNGETQNRYKCLRGSQTTYNLYF